MKLEISINRDSFRVNFFKHTSQIHHTAIGKIIIKSNRAIFHEKKKQLKRREIKVINESQVLER